MQKKRQVEETERDEKRKDKGINQCKDRGRKESGGPADDTVHLEQ